MTLQADHVAECLGTLAFPAGYISWPWDHRLETVFKDEIHEPRGKFRLRGVLQHRRDLDLHVVAFGKGRRLVFIRAFGNHVIGRRCRREDHVGLASRNSGTSIPPALGDGHNLRRQFRPRVGRVIAIDRLHPQQAEAGCRRAGILNDDAHAVGRIYKFPAWIQVVLPWSELQTKAK